MRHPRLELVALALAVAVTAAMESRAEGDPATAARSATRVLAQALTSGDSSSMRGVLPSRGKVLLRLTRLGPEDGYFSASQVETLFADFLSSGRVTAFDLVRVEPDADGFALVHGKAVIVDREGRTGRIELHLAFEPEDARWVLREMRESP